MQSLIASIVTASFEHPGVSVVLLIALRSTSVIWPPIAGFPLDLLIVHLLGPLDGLVVAEAGIMLGASTAFGVTRIARGVFPERVQPRLQQLQVIVDEAASLRESDSRAIQLRSWLLIRLCTNSLFDPLSYAAGLTSTRFSSFFYGSLLGNIPSMALFYYLEGRALRFDSIVWIPVTLLFLAVTWIQTSRWLRTSARGRRSGGAAG